MGVIRFHHVFEKEIKEAVAARRARYEKEWQRPNQAEARKMYAEWEVGKPPPGKPEPQSTPALEREENDVDDHLVKRPTIETELIGLALSGGGVRSAAFCLGALQALDEEKVLCRVDYLSTVSGGGYIGTSMVATMSVSGSSAFQFSSKLTPEENRCIRHIRDHSNYLFPRGLSDAFGNLGIYLRGLMANVILLLPWLALAAWITISVFPTPDHLHDQEKHPYLEFLRLFDLNYFAITRAAAVVFAGWLAFWGLHRSFWAGQPDVDTIWMLLARWGLIALCIIAWCELQPYILARMTYPIISPLEEAPLTWTEFLQKRLSGLLTTFFTIVVPALSALLALLSSILGAIAKRDRDASSTRRNKRLSFVVNGAVYFAAAAAPLLLWAAYLHLSAWGICAAGPGCIKGMAPPPWLRALASPDLWGALLDWISRWAPAWLTGPLTTFAGDYGRAFQQPMQALYFGVFVVIFFVQLFLMPNANSLHRLYRDRLSKAFLFHPNESIEERSVSLAGNLIGRFPPKFTSFWRRAGMRVSKGVAKAFHWVTSPMESLRQWLSAKKSGGAGSDDADGEALNVVTTLMPLDELKFSGIKDHFGPYQIINAALNIRGSKYANQRGRDADFFVFTSKYTGSRATGYIPTPEVESAVSDLDLAAAMAISGAAASSNMGGNTIKALTPTLAILNIRLGFWLPNPRVIAGGKLKSLFAQVVDQFYFLKEMLGLLTEDSDLIYLTDGGHIENLGIYELLRRRCALIIAVDAEADPGMNFNSFIALQRHALIDLGVRINLPWSTIRDATRKATALVAETGGVTWSKAQHGPHVALGEIAYPGDRTGVLLYIKASLSGDENDYIIDYKRRNARFPHETTADQFFSEEQFEVYRALGFHATRRALNGGDEVAMSSESLAWSGPTLDRPEIRTLRRLLFGKAHEEKSRRIALAKPRSRRKGRGDGKNETEAATSPLA